MGSNGEVIKVNMAKLFLSSVAPINVESRTAYSRPLIDGNHLLVDGQHDETELSLEVRDTDLGKEVVFESCMVSEQLGEAQQVKPLKLQPATKDPLLLLSPDIDRNTLDFSFFTNKRTIRHLNGANANVMFIMRGLPGSGKSLIVKILKSTYNNIAVCSADNFFMSEDGEYVFDEKKLSSAHGDCQQKAKAACQSNVHIVVIDNTNVKKWEMKFYVELANTYGYVVVLVQPQTPWKWNAEELFHKTTHGVPLEALRRKIRTFDDFIPAYYGWFLSNKMTRKIMTLSSKLFAQCIKSFPGMKRAFLKELNIHPDQIDEETGEGILSEYFSRNSHSSRLLHCTSCFLRWGKMPGSLEYHQQPLVQKACGQLFELVVTSLVFTTKTMGARVNLSPEAAALFERPEEKEWTSQDHSMDYHEGSVEDGYEVEMKKGKSGKKVARTSKRLSRNNKWLSKKNGALRGVAASGDGSAASAKSNQHGAAGESTFENYEEPCHGSEDVASFSETFPLVKNTGFARSAHFTLMTAHGVESRETNFDVLSLCDIENCHVYRPSDFVSVLKGRACYYGNGICCVYLDKPICVKSLFSGYY